MPNLELRDWLLLGGGPLILLAALGALKLAYSAKGYRLLPESKPRFAWLPKYAARVSLTTEDREAELATLLTGLGFREIRRGADLVEFSRGSELGDFSVKIAKVVASATLPLENPVVLRVGYGVAFGCAFDTGDLWRFCVELQQKIAVAQRGSRASPRDSDNPFQPPASD